MNDKEKREKIFAAIKELMAEGCSLADIKVSQIANRAGIGKGSIYMYFASKEAVIADAIEYFVDKWLIPFEEFEIDRNRDFKELFYSFLNIQYDVTQETAYFFNPTNSSDYMNYINGSALPMTIDIVKKARLRYIDALESVLKVGLEQNKLKNINLYSVNVASQSIIMMFQYYSLKDVIEAPESYRDLSYNECIDMVYDMILKVCS